MPGSHPSNSPISGSNSANGSAVSDTVPNQRHHLVLEQHHHYDRGQSGHVYYPEDLPYQHNHRLRQQDRQRVINTNDDRMNSEDPQHFGGGGGTDLSSQGPSIYPDFPSQLSDFIRSNQSEPGVDEQPHTIESYIDLEDNYQSILAAVSNMRVGYPRSSEDELVSSQLDGSTDRVLSRSPYNLQSELEEVIVEDNEDMIMAHGHDDGSISVADETDGDLDRNQSSSSESAHRHIYDMQHIMLHSQRAFESQLRQSRAEYNRQSAHQQPSRSRMDNDEHILESMGVPSSFESFHSDTSPLSSNETISTAALNQYSPTYGMNGFHQQPSMSISSSYFTSTSESTIVLSSPPPGRTSGSFLYHPQANTHSHSARAVYGSNRASMNNSSASTLRHGSGPYRPFVTGRELAAQQQAYQNHQSVSEQPSIDPTSTRPGAFNPWETEPSEYSGDELDANGGQIESGDLETGHWSTYGSVTGIRSFEEHRHQHHHRQRQLHQRMRPSEQMQHHYQPHAHDGTLGGSSAAPTARPAASALGLGASPLLTRMHQEPLRRGPQASSFPGSGVSNIPIPSRYINPPPFSHTQYTTSTGSHMFRPHDISTGYNHNGYRLLNPSLDSNATGHDRYVNGQPLPYSETIERAEAGGWTAPNLSSTAGSVPSSQRNDGTHSYSGRTNIGMKEVVRMACRFCDTIICERGMKAQLLADHTIGLMSTDDEPHSIQLVGEEYRPTNCSCRIMDAACLVCGNAIGYHIIQPCERCLSAENNGHLWLFHPEYIASRIRLDPQVEKPLLWADLPPPEHDFDTLSLLKVQLGSREGRLIVGGMVRREYDAICR